MRFIHYISTFFFLASWTYYRRADAFKKFILKGPPFPLGYLAHGDYDTNCTSLRSVAEGPTASEQLSFCEDAIFWEHHDTNGQVIQRPVILSCDAGRKNWNTVMGPLRDPEPRGSLWLYMPDEPSYLLGSSNISRNRAHPISLVNYPPDHDFHPLGIAIWPSHGASPSNFYVINHARKRTFIEQFVMSPDKPTEAIHIRSIASSYFVSPNGLALTSPDAFYVTNNHLMTRRLPVLGRFLPDIESMFALPLGFVLHITLNDPSHHTYPIANLNIVKLFIPFPNGIALSPSGEEVALASSSMGELLFFKRNPTTNALTLRRTVSVPFLPDNVHYAVGRQHDGKKPNVIVAGHPNLKDLQKVVANVSGATTASWVVAVIPNTGRVGEATAQSSFDLEAPISASSRVKGIDAEWTLKTIFQSNGEEHLGGFTASSTGLVDEETGTVYVTGLYAREGALVCKTTNGLGN